MSSPDPLKLDVELRGSLAEVDPAEWDTLVGDDDPFVEHAFLSALESSGSVGADEGWLPIHVLVRDAGRLVAALPLYAKDHSWGEFIFDFAWANAARQLGVSYYPKLVSMVPFTPATGRRLLMAPDMSAEAIAPVIVAGARAAADEVGASSIHALFLTLEERRALVGAGLWPRLSYQFHWDDQGYRTFDDYLARFRSGKRKNVRKERRRVAESELTIRTVKGPELEDSDWEALKLFYRANCRRHGSYPYLKPSFFEAIRRTHAERLVAVIASREGEPVAASISFEKGSRLYGRYWGAVEDHEHLHFELCYYRLIDRAIDQKIPHFEAGAQGGHKLRRGMVPTEIHSAHWVRDPRLGRAVREFLPDEAMAVKREMAALAEHLPFSRE